MQHLISVIVCTYNQQDTIARTLDSILMQECHIPFEIIIGDDHSADETLAICQTYEKRFPQTIRVIANTKNKGVIDNYFDCLLSARGSYIADCAGDDYWIDPLKLEKQVNVLESHPHVSMVLTDWCFFNEQTQRSYPGNQRKLPPISSGKSMLKDIITQTGMSVFHLCTSLYRADIFRKCYDADAYIFRNKDFGCEDIQIAFSMALHGDIAFLQDVTLCYSIGHPSASSLPSESSQFHFVRQVTSLSYYLAKLHHIDIEEFLRKRIFSLGMHAFRAHNSELRNETKEYMNKWNVKADVCIHALFLIMRYQYVWKMALKIRCVAIKMKRWLH